jgi:enoyl-CoA hydratase/carnithine racemase
LHVLSSSSHPFPHPPLPSPQHHRKLRAAIITGAGKAFSAGGDLEFLRARTRDTPDNNIKVMLAFYRRFLCVRDLPVPTIAAING